MEYICYATFYKISTIFGNSVSNFEGWQCCQTQFWKKTIKKISIFIYSMQ